MARSSVAEACRGKFNWKPAGRRTLRGVSAPVTIYLLVA